MSVPATVLSGTDLDMLDASVTRAVDALSGLDAVVTVAGLGMVGTFASGEPAMWRELLDLNLIGPLATVRYAVHHFGPVGRRDVVLIGSTGAITPSAASVFPLNNRRCNDWL